MQLPKIVSLFSGAGGLDLGFKDAGFDIVLAIDVSEAAVRTHNRNFQNTTAIAADLIKLGPMGVLDHLRQLLKHGQPIGVIGGPPCQGFSRANTQSTANDPRNTLAFLYLDIVALLQEFYDVNFVLFENVLGIRDRKHFAIFSGIMSAFQKIELHPNVQEHSALDFGVAQTRNRVIISGFKDFDAQASFIPQETPRANLTVRSVISGLPEPVFCNRNKTQELSPYHPNHWTMRPLSKRFSDPNGVQSAGRSFRRLDWDRPSPTVAYGHREIHVHPDGHRRLSIFEAMLLQGFPTDFVLEGTLSDQVEQVSNAVPPPLALSLAQATANALASAASGHSRDSGR